MTSDSAKRLAVQPGPARTLVLEPWPRIPESMIRRFPELKAWDEDCNRVSQVNSDKVRKFIEASMAQTP